MNQTFLSILNKYFANIPEENILLGDKRSIDIPFEWLFTEELDRDIIQKTLVNILMQSNSTYREKAYFKHNNPNKLNVVSIQFDRFTNSIQLYILGADEWSKMVITDDPNPHRKIPQITSQQLNEEISKTLKKEKLDLITSPKMHLSTDAKTTFAKMLEVHASPENINTAMCNLAENLIAYYSELINNRDNTTSSFYGGIINQKQSDTDTNKYHSMISSPSSRKSPIYSFVERSAIFNNLHPTFQISSDILGNQGQVIKNAYTTYIFRNPRDYKGYLFISEPLEGSHETRMFFITDEQFKKHKTDDDNKFVDINGIFISKSGEEFRGTRYTKVLKHTDLDSFADRVNYFVTGEKSSRISSTYSLFKQFDSQLFEGKLVTKKELKQTILSKEIKSSDIISVISVVLPSDKIKDTQIGGNQK